MDVRSLGKRRLGGEGSWQKKIKEQSFLGQQGRSRNKASWQ